MLEILFCNLLNLIEIVINQTEINVHRDNYGIRLLSKKYIFLCKLNPFIYLFVYL